MNTPNTVQVHQFDKQLAESENPIYEPFWREVYQVFFPTMVNCMPGFGDTESQRRGIDRVILLRNGELITCEEKLRQIVDPGDFLLEYISSDNTQTPGWIEKNLAVDFLVYAFYPQRRAYIFPWLLLRAAWLRCGHIWKKAYPAVKAPNEGYATLSIPVPRDELFRAIQEVSQVELVIPGDDDDDLPF